jgi:DUF1680 family protein
MNKPVLFLAGIVTSAVVCVESARAQGGDQFLDGIGETALVTRYVFNGNALDASRNARHATVQGSGGTFVKDAQRGWVLSLPGGDGAFVQIPGRVFEGLDTLSVSGWLLVRQQGGGPFFDFGRNSESSFFCVPCGEDYSAGITRSGREGATRASAPAIPTHRWVHVAVVLEATRQTLSLYLDGRRVGRVPDVDWTLDRVLGTGRGDVPRAFIGRSQDAAGPHLNALVHDVRIYSIALTDQQVAVIHRNALPGGASEPLAETSPEPQPATQARGIAQPLASSLVGVREVAVETRRGHLPRLPPEVPGLYAGNVQGPDVRVLWPSPTNNLQSLTNEGYTLIGQVPGTDLRARATVTVKPALAAALPERTLEPFPLGAVALLPDEKRRDTPFLQNRAKFIRVLAETNPDRFLYMFRNAFGQPQPEGAEPLGVWDSQTSKLRGHATGHYLSALAQAYASTTDDASLHATFGGKLNYAVEALHQLSRLSGSPTNAGAPFNADPAAVPPGPGQAGYHSDLSQAGIRTDYWNWGKGFISAYPPDQFILLEQGAVYGTGDNQVWAPYYTLHKLLAGLLDCYEHGGNTKALVIAEDMARWVQCRLQRLPVETRISMWNRYIAGEYGGMNEALARLSRLAADPGFLDCAKLFDNVEFFFGDRERSGGLARNVDTLRGRHANQHIPQIIGAVETYRATRQGEYWRVAENFWEICRHSYMYSIGGVAGARQPNNAECFTAHPDRLFAEGFSSDGQNETCATYNLLKLSRQLFLFDPQAKYMDYYEQALYNHILASVAPDDPGNTYHVPLNPGARKQFGNAQMDGFTCCNGTAIESNTKLHDTIYFRSADDSAVYVNLYVPSRLDWATRRVTLTQTTAFPYGDSTTLTIGGGGTFAVKVRVPGWTSQEFVVSLNGARQRHEARPGTYLTLSRHWREGDTLQLQMPFSFHLRPVMDQPNVASLFYGPVLLAAQEREPRVTWRPITLKGEPLGEDIVGDPRTLRFSVGDAEFKPFYATYGRGSVYLEVTLK